MTTNDPTAVPAFPPEDDDVITLAIRQERFNILTMALTSNSVYFKNMFHGPSASALKIPKRTADGAYVVHADPEIFKHILSYIETSTFPFFWGSRDGFDYNLYAHVLQMANFFQMNDLVHFIQNTKYELVVNTERVWDSQNANSATWQERSKNITGSSTIETKVFEAVEDLWKCPGGHGDNARCTSGKRGYGCWTEDTRAQSKVQIIKVVTVQTKVTFDWTRLCP